MIRPAYHGGHGRTLFLGQQIFQFLIKSTHNYQSRRSTKTWMVPPHDKPIFSTFCPSVIASMQASKTAGSTQPPLTEPVNSPLSLTAILAPGLRGAEPAMETTVARATFSPRARQRSISGRTSRIKHLSFWGYTILDLLHPATALRRAAVLRTGRLSSIVCKRLPRLIKLSRLWAGRKLSMYGRAVLMPIVRGR